MTKYGLIIIGIVVLLAGCSDYRFSNTKCEESMFFRVGIDGASWQEDKLVILGTASFMCESKVHGTYTNYRDTINLSVTSREPFQNVLCSCPVKFTYEIKNAKEKEVYTINLLQNGLLVDTVYFSSLNSIKPNIEACPLSSQKNCISKAALRDNNESMCRLLLKDSEIDQCLETLAYTYNSPETCRKISDERFIDECLYLLAQKYQEETYCELIKSTSGKEFCRNKLLSRNPS